MNSTKLKKVLSVILAALMLVSAVPTQVFAATVENPWENGSRTDNVFLDALKYLGYDITRFTKYNEAGSEVSSSYRSDIGYNTGGANGTETTSSGKPNVSTFESKGLCCASYAAYVYFNYLPNVYGLDMSDFAKPSNLRSTTSWATACEKWVSSGVATKTSLNVSCDSTSGLKKLQSLPIGTLLIFKDADGTYMHTGIYAGYRSTGTYTYYYQTQVGNSRGPEVCLINNYNKNGEIATLTAAYTPIIPEATGRVGVQKVDDAGNAVSGAKIGVYSDSACTKLLTTLTTNAQGKAVYEDYLIEGTKVYFKETTAPTGYDKSTQVVSATVVADKTTYASTKIVDNRQGWIRIQKCDDSGAILGAGYEFSVYSDKACTKKVNTVTTDAKGYCASDYLTAGTYYVKETKLPSTDKIHNLNSTVYTVNVPKGTYVYVTHGQWNNWFSNDLKRGNADVIKTSEDGVVEGVSFRLFGTSDSGTEIDMTAKTDSSGKATFSNVLIGTYTVEELNVANIYVAPKSQTVVVNSGQTATLTFNNALKKGNVRIVKTSDDGLVENVGFRLTGKSDSGITVDTTAVTDSNGVAEFKNILIGSNYTVTEIDTGEQYVIPSPININVEWNKVTSASFHNTLKRGDLTIVKVDSLDETPLSGVGYKVYDANGNEVREGYTDENGELVFEDLTYGKYSYQEFKAPEGFVIDEALYDFEIIEDGQKITVRRENDAVQGSIIIHKTDPQNQPLSEVCFLLEYSTDGGATYQSVTSRADNKITVGGCTSSGLENGVLVTDENGEACFTGLRISTQTGKILYRVTETQTQDGFQLLSDYAFEGELTEKENIDIEFTVVNAPVFVLPATGGNSLPFLIAFGAILLFIGIFITFNIINKNKKRGRRNMNKFKKVLTLCLTLIMMLGTFTSVFAANSTTAIIDTTKKASLDLYKYDFTSANEDGILEWDSYVSDGKKNTTVENTLSNYAIQGVEFTYIKVADITTYSENETDGNKNMVLYSFQKNDKTNTFLANIGLTVADAYTSDSNSYSFKSDILNKALNTKLGENSSALKNELEKFVANYDGYAMQQTNANGYSSVSGLELGLYLVVETAVPENVYSTTAPFLVSLPMTTIDGLDWNYNVTVYPKNETDTPILEKTVRESKNDTGKNNGVANDITDGYAHTATASNGDVLEYQVISKLPSITSAATALTEYTFFDTLNKGIEYNKKDVKIEWFKDAECTDLITTWVENDGNFTVTYGIGADNATTMTVKMTENGLKKINFSDEVYDSSSLYAGYSDCTARVTYACTVNSSADVEYGDNGNDNKVNLTWRRTSMDYSDTLTDDCHFFTYGIDLTKEFSDNNGNFANVKFLIHNDTDNYWVTAQLNEGEGVYYVTGHKNAENEATAFTPVLSNGENGKIIVKGLEDDEYTITEIKTDNGYTLLKKAINLVIKAEQNGVICSVCGSNKIVATASIDGKPVTMSADNGSLNALVPFKVINHKGFDIPFTGAEGVFALTMLAGALLTVSITVILFINKKRKKGEE